MDMSLEENEEIIMANINAPDKLGEEVKFFNRSVSQIIKNGIIKNSTKEQTEEFMNEFIPKLIVAILMMRADHSQGEILNQFLEDIIPLFVNFFFDKKSSKLIEKSIEIISKSKSPFYISTMPYHILQNNLLSPFYENNLTAFGKTNIIQVTINEMKKMTIDDFEYYFSALKLIYKQKRYFDQRNLNSFVHSSTEFFDRIFSSIEESKLRNLPEKDTRDSFSYLKQLAPESRQDHKSLEKVQFNLAIRYVKAPYLNKRYYGLSLIKSELNLGTINKTILCSRLESERIIPYVLDNMHDELITDFCSIFRAMAIKGFVVLNQLSKLWNISIHQNPLTIEPYFSGLNLIYTGLPKDLKTGLWDIMKQSDVFPIAALQFIKKASLSGIDDEQKVPLFQVLKNYYDECTESEVLPVLSDTLSSLVPNNPEFTANLQKECLQLFKEQIQLDLALSLFKASFKSSIDSEKARQTFNLIMTSLNGVNDIDSTQFLEVIEKVIKKMKGSLNDDEFNNLLKLLVNTIKVNSDSVFRFYQNITQKDALISKEQNIQLYTEICKLGLSDLQSQNFVIYLFEKINKNNFCTDSTTNKSIPKDATIFTGIDDLWYICLNTKESKVSFYLCQLYANSKKVTNVKVYIKYCMENTENQSALLALYQIIKFIESNFEKSLLGVIENRYISVFDYCSVQLIGDVTLTIKVPQEISFCAFRDRVSVLTGIERERLTFYEGVNMVQSQSFILFDSLQLEVRKWNSTIRKLPEFDKKYLPSTILSEEKYQKKLFDLISSEDEQIASSAFLILNDLPTNDHEIELLTSKSPNWNEIFNFDNKYLLYYRINAIGHLAENNENIADSGVSWINYFYDTGGALTLFNNAFNDNFNAKNSSEQFSILLEICNLILSKMEDKNKKLPIITEKTINAIFNQALEISKDKEFESILLLLLGILEKLSDVDSSFVYKCKLFKNLFEVTIFSSNKLIRTLISSIVKRINLQDAKKELISLLEGTVHLKCKEYFSLVIPLVKTEKNPASLFKKIKKIIYKEYFISENDDPFLTMAFIPPNKYFTWGIFTIANILVQSMNEIKGMTKLFNFIIDHILFNKLCYFNLNPDFFSFLYCLIKKDPTLLHSLLPKMKIITEVSAVITKNDDIHLTHSLKPKGLINLGATCYMNSSIQQLFNIPEFRDEILSSRNGDNIEWFYHFQFLLAQLLFYPTDCINPSHFVNKWQWYDNEKVNVHVQMDAGEFINLLLSRASDIVPDCDNCFKGIIYHDIVGTDVDFHSESVEYFTVFPVEVKDHSNLEESLQSFLIPDEFRDDNKYNAEGIGKINANRYHSIMKTPDILIIQLKRFTYSLLNGEREKLNSRFEFPLELDLDPIMTENVNKAQQQQKLNSKNKSSKSKNKEASSQSTFSRIPSMNLFDDENGDESKSKNSENMFDLIGVQMHLGDALSGHYFLYSDSSTGWYKYDDNYIGQFDPNRLKYLVFGGIQPASYGDPRGIKIENNENAYILYYRKRKPKQETNLDLNNPSVRENENKTDNEEESGSEEESNFDNNDMQINPFYSNINEKVTAQLQKDILKMIVSHTITNPQCKDFLLDSFDLSDDPLFQYDYIVVFIQNVKNKKIILITIEKLNLLIINSDEISLKFLENTDLHRKFLIENDKHEVRHSYSKVIIAAIDKVGHPEIYLNFLEKFFASETSYDHHRNDIGIPLNHIIEKYKKDFDSEKWLEIIFNYLHNIKFIDEDNSKLDLSSLLDSIRLMLTSPHVSHGSIKKYRGMLFDMKFLCNLFKSNSNSRSLFDLLLVFKSNDDVMQNFFETMKSNWDGISPHEAVLYFTMLVLLNNEASNENIEWFFKNIEKQQLNFIETFIQKLEKSTVDGMSTVFVNHSKLWVKPFLFSYSEKVRLNLNDLFNIIFKESNEIEIDNEIETETETEAEIEAKTETENDISKAETENESEDLDKDKKKKKHKKRILKLKTLRNHKSNRDLKNKKEDNEDDSENDVESLTKILIKNLSLLTELSIKRNNKKSSLYTSGVSTAQMYPYASFLDLLSMTIRKSHESHKIALSSSKEIIESFKKLSEVDMIGVDVIKHFMILFSLIIKNDDQSKEFFNNARAYNTVLTILSVISFDPATRLTSINDVSCLISITPIDYVNDFFKSIVFEDSVLNCLNSTTDFSPTFAKFIVNNVNESNLQRVESVLWSDDSFKKNVLNAPQFFIVSSEIMKKIPSSSLVFMELWHGQHTLQAVKKSLLIKDDEFSYLGAMQTLCLSSFVTSFYLHHSKTKLFDTFLSSLNKNFETVASIFERLHDSRNKADVYNSIAQLMISVYPINSQFQKLVIDNISKGILFNASFDNEKIAGELHTFVIFMLIQSKDQKDLIINIISNELELLCNKDKNKNKLVHFDMRKISAILEILSSEILSLLPNSNDKLSENDINLLDKINNYYNVIFNSSKNIDFFTRSTIMVITKMKPELIEIWRNSCALLIPNEVRNIIKSHKKSLNSTKSQTIKDINYGYYIINLKYAFEFAFVITNNDKNLVMNKTSLSENEISQFLDICHGLADPSADDLAYLLSKLAQH